MDSLRRRFVDSMGRMSHNEDLFKGNNSYSLTIEKDMVPLTTEVPESYIYENAHKSMMSSLPVYCSSYTQPTLILSQNTLRPGIATSPLLPAEQNNQIRQGINGQLQTSQSSGHDLQVNFEIEEETYTCRWLKCDATFLVLDDLVNHVNDQHVKVERPDVEFQCKWTGCSRQGRGFNARYKMLIHVRTHTNEKPHQCSVCTKSFSRLENLKIHHRSHTGEKPYTCPYVGCNKAYSNSSDRFKHVRTHQERKPYICKLPGCDKRYTDPSSLRKHVRTHKHFVPSTTPSVTNGNKKKAQKSVPQTNDNSVNTKTDEQMSPTIPNSASESPRVSSYDPLMNNLDHHSLLSLPVIMNTGIHLLSSAPEADVTSVINVVPLVIPSSSDTSISSDYQDGPLDLSRSPVSPPSSISNLSPIS